MKNYLDKNEMDLPLYPGLLPYGHNVGTPAFRPNSELEIKNTSQKAMSQQVKMQKNQIIEQLQLLQRQYTELVDRELISNLNSNPYQTKFIFSILEKVKIIILYH